MNITRKITLGYIILILIPVMIFGYYYYAQLHGNITQQFAEGRQKILEQAYANLKMDFTRIQSVHRVYQYNSYVTDYLDGTYDSELESVYSFIKYISPLYSQSLFGNSQIESLKIYKIKDNVFPITDHFVDYTTLNSTIIESTYTLKPGSGIWMLVNPEEVNPELTYYQNIYNSQFTEKIGLLEVKINNSLFKKFYEAAGVESPWSYSLITEQDSYIGQMPLNEAIDKDIIGQWEHNKNSFIVNNENVINYLKIEELGLYVVIMGKVGDVLHSLTRSEVTVIIIIIMLLVGLSLVYYLYASSITKRILRLARHMRTLDDDNLRQYIIIQDKLKENDEIGFLIETYNSMLIRMDLLINNIHRAELLNKEAAYKVLQAQIKPHFLYNTLETIRMLAEANNDKEVANISFWFGKLMRYSLSSEQDEITLAQEIEMAKFYMQIHKMRFQNRLTYSIDESINTAKVRCPRFIIQPLIENSINHSVSAVIRPVHVQVVVSETEHEINISIIDNGKGIPEEKLSTIQSLLTGKKTPNEDASITGMGLVNVNDRIKTYFGGASRLEVNSELEKGTSINIIIEKRGAC